MIVTPSKWGLAMELLDFKEASSPVGRSSEDGAIAPGAAHRRLLLRECPTLGHEHLHSLATRENVTCLEQQIPGVTKKSFKNMSCYLFPFYCTQLTIEHSGKLPWSPKMLISKIKIKQIPNFSLFPLPKKGPLASDSIPVSLDPKANLESRVRAVLDLVDSKREDMQ